MSNITGLITVNGKEILEVDDVPSSGAGTPAPMGSIAMYDSGAAGSVFVKTGAADTAWAAIDITNSWDLAGNALTGGSPITPNEFIGSTNDFDVKFLRNSAEIMRMFSGGVLIGLNASIGGKLQLAADAADDDILKECLSPLSNPVIRVTRISRVTTVGAVSSTFNIAIPNNYNAKLECNVVARQTAGATGAVGDGASYTRTVHAKNAAGAVSLLKTQTDFTYEISNALDFTLGVSGANVQGSCLGGANRNLSWGIHSTLLMITT